MTMRNSWLFLVVLAVTPALALAGVSGTLHDKDALASAKGGYAGSPPTTTGGTCSYCHVPHKAVGARLFPVAGISGAEAWLDNTTGVNKVTPRLCNTCHNSSSFDSDITGNAGMYLRPYQSTSHMDSPTVLGTYGESLVANARVDNTGKLECTSCHDVHSNAKRPFIMTYGVSGDIAKNCEGCHGGRNNDAVGMRASNAAGNHPTNNDPTAPVNSTTNKFVGTIDNAFKVAQNPNEDGSAITSGTAFKIGGHLNAGATGTVRCYTCHAVHGTNAAAPSDGLLVLNNTAQPTAALCEGCHTGPNPGDSGKSTHPVDTLQTAWAVDVSGKPGGWPWGSSGGTNTIICSSCHDMHYASPATSNLRRNGTTINAAATPFTTVTVCNACHGTTAWNEATYGKHHPVGVFAAKGSGTDYRANPSVGTTNWAGPRAWSASSDLYPIDNDAITCATCHSTVSGSSYKTAHNLNSWPALTGTDNASEMCIDCHSYNPSTYLQTLRFGGSTTSLMTHYVGAIVTTSYKRTAAFGSSKVNAMKYPNIGGSDYIVCESCHTLKKDTNIGSSAKKSFSWNDNTTPASINVKSSPISLMVEKSGNAITYTDAANYLCTGCHGATPGGNTSHPVMPTSSTGATSGVTGQLAAQGATTTGQATLPSANNAVNCDSCHRPHNATVGTGALILESQVTTPVASVKPAFALVTDNSYLDQEGLCKRCHNR